jgi:hypothetical protein
LILARNSRVYTPVGERHFPVQHFPQLAQRGGEDFAALKRGNFLFSIFPLAKDKQENAGEENSVCRASELF